MNDHNINRSHTRALLKWLNDFAEQGIFTTDIDLNLLSWNHWLELQSGHRAKDLVGHQLFAVYPDLKRRGLDRIYQQALQGQVVFLSQRLHSHLIELPPSISSPSLSQMQQSVRVAPLIEKGEIFGTITVIEDVTERVLREMELQQKIRKLEQTETRLSLTQAQLEHLLASSPAIIYTCHPRGDYPHKLVSDNLTTQLGYEATEWVDIPNLWRDRIHPDDLQKTWNLRSQILQLKHLILEYRFRHKNGTYRWLRDEMKLTFDVEGKPEEIVGVLLDITDKKKLETQLLRAQRLESIGTLASGIAHDLNNILTPILASVQMFQLGVSEEKQQKMLKLIETNTKRGANLIKQVLSFARGFEGKLEIFQVKHLMGEVAEVVQETFPKSIEIQSQVARDLWTISGDPTQLHQILMNLCVNARDAMPDGGELLLAAENVELDEREAAFNLDAREGCYVVITIADTGTGIEPEVADRMFEPFFTTKEFAKGSGLGLPTVMGIVKGHNGFIDVDTQIGRGTRFRVYLPASRDTEPIADEGLELMSGRGELILVVDDEEPIREITQTTLENFGYRVVVASNGLEAIELYRRSPEPIDCVLLDLMMPVMGGKDAIVALWSLNPRVRIIAVSGYCSASVAADVAKLGVTTFLAKPYTTPQLLQVLREFLDRRANCPPRSPAGRTTNPSQISI
ncbi:MAG: PAS domain-containing hybrid sensor histidine kinase/response regulator [Limnospira sp.]